MTEQTPRMIQREEIRKGDRIRRSVVSEYTASQDITDPSSNDSYTYELLERPVPLPTEPGVVISWDSPHYKHLATLEKADQWLYEGMNYTNAGMAGRIADTVRGDSTYTALHTEAEVVARFAAEVLAEFASGLSWDEDLRAVAARYGVDL